MTDLKGKTAAVTGSTSGIGLAYARAFASAGANVVINGFGAPADIEKERSAIETDYKVKAAYSAADMTKPAEIAEMIALGEKTFGSVDILVNNAGIQFVSPIEEFPIEKWDAIIAINLSSAFHGIRAAILGLRLGQARHRRPDQDCRARSRDPQDHLQLHQPRLCLDPAGRAPDSGDHEGA
jgi:3-hydroxybutyrate dehydrogenase